MKRMIRWVSVFWLCLVLTALPVCAAEENGTYEINVELTGGSGRASVESPMKLTVADGVITATVVWSSPYYDFMLLDGTYYYPVNEDGNSTFEIPLTSLSEDVVFDAETLAMSEPHTISYVLKLDESSLVRTDGQDEGMSAGAIVVAVILIALSVVLYYRKKKM